ncbi:hypothetical protein GCM10009122_47920 [Fulvivirga kasyanovii]|uniref:VCBS repeat-containing protein n=1 Tax=Fulvivirga kasyanovii TaxID=396812 RepID=A0ABW9RIF2_9BACT|nr:hypothetical protein [Fulvivirga kasyanovii]MTI23766.1 hypothetical protein [Fulvivirga kasyanovii]
MRIELLTAFIAVIILNPAAGQSDSSLSKNSNSYKDRYNQKDININYSYNVSTQTHNYSNNWDFDGDKKTDSLFFIGNDGAHLYFHLKIILSSNHKTYNFPSLNSDMPFTDTIDEFYTSESPLFPSFIAHDFDSDGRDELYFKNDKDFSPLSPEWINRGITSSYLLLDFINGELALTNFDMKQWMRKLFGEIDATWTNTFWPENIPVEISQLLEKTDTLKMDDFVVFTVWSKDDFFALHVNGIFYIKNDVRQFVEYRDIWKKETICYAILIDVLRIEWNVDLEDFNLLCDQNNAVVSFNRIIDFGRSLSD